MGHSYNESEECYNPYSQQPLDRSNTIQSRYGGQVPPTDSDRTLPPVPPEEDAPRGPNVLRRSSMRNEYSWDRSETRQSLTPLTRPPGNSARDIKRWRRDHHGNLWTRGSRAGCIGRFCGCTVLIALLLIVSIVLALVMWVRPPDIQFTGVSTAQNGSTFEATTNQEFKVNLGFGINVTNPNYFSATFTSITADIFYPINNTNVGGGEEKDITFHSHSTKDITFPFSFVYSKAADPQGLIIQDLVKRCGFIDPSTKQDISITYKITLKVRVVVASVGPSFGGTANFACPVNADQIKPFLAGLGVNIPGLL